MALNLRNIAADFSRSFLKSSESVNSLCGTAPFEVFHEIATVCNFVGKTSPNSGNAIASHSGFSIVLNPVKLWVQHEETLSDKEFDGYFVGENGKIFAPGTTFDEIPAVTPAGGAHSDETLIYVNGIRTDLAGMAKSLQAIADKTVTRIVGIYHATEDFGPDILQNNGDRLDVGSNRAIDTLADTIYKELRAGHGVHLLAHSKGALVTSRALRDLKNRLMLEDEMSRNEADALMNHIKIEIFGGAARRYPDGPRFVHYVNLHDGKLAAFGLRSWLNSFSHKECEPVRHFFCAGKPLFSHSFEEFYLPERIPFDTARQIFIGENL